MRPYDYICIYALSHLYHKQRFTQILMHTCTRTAVCGRDLYSVSLFHSFFADFNHVQAFFPRTDLNVAWYDMIRGEDGGDGDRASERVEVLERVKGKL